MIVRMMTHQLEVSILAAPLAQMDRRALSEAWYTALRFAPNPQVAVARSTALPAPASHAEHRFAQNLEPARAAGTLLPAAMASHSRGLPPGLADAAPVAARARQNTLAQRIERAFGGKPMSAKRATFSLGRGNARVHIV